jgi:isopentenyl phosphate kinase
MTKLTPIPGELYFLKLGGSLITEKNVPSTPRQEVLERLALEIGNALETHPHLRLVLGHGSGSFGHVPASKYRTREGVSTRQEWGGFVEVWREAAALNRLVMEALAGAGLPVLSFAPSASVISRDGIVESWNLAPLSAALQKRLIPVVYGDVVFDEKRGGTILSTEDLFGYLVHPFKPKRMLLAGLEQGVWADFPKCKNLLIEITPSSSRVAQAALGGSAATDVTGGMLSKVQQSLSLVQANSQLEVFIFTGETAGNVEKALSGDRLGTCIRAEPERA